MTVGSVEHAVPHNDAAELLPGHSALFLCLVLVPVIGLIATGILQVQLNTQMSQKNLSLKERVHIQGQQDGCQILSLYHLLLCLNALNNVTYSISMFEAWIIVIIAIEVGIQSIIYIYNRAYNRYYYGSLALPQA